MQFPQQRSNVEAIHEQRRPARTLGVREKMEELQSTWIRLYRSHQPQNSLDTANTNKVGIVSVCPKRHCGVCRISFRKVCCKFPKFAVCNQLSISRIPEKEGEVLALRFTNESNALRQLFCRFGSGRDPRNEAKPKPVLYCHVSRPSSSVFHVHTHYVA